MRRRSARRQPLRRCQTAQLVRNKRLVSRRSFDKDRQRRRQRHHVYIYGYDRPRVIGPAAIYGQEDERRGRRASIINGRTSPRHRGPMSQSQTNPHTVFISGWLAQRGVDDPAAAALDTPSRRVTGIAAQLSVWVDGPNAAATTFKINPFLPRVPTRGTVTMGFDGGLANRPFLVFDFRALWRSRQSARVPESQKLKNGRLASTFWDVVEMSAPAHGKRECRKVVRQR